MTWAAPVSPIAGHVRTTSAASLTPLIQLKNPIASGVKLVIYELMAVLTVGPSTGIQVRHRRTRTPLALAGAITAGYAQRLNRSDPTAILAQLNGATDVANHTALTDQQSQVSYVQALDNQIGGLTGIGRLFCVRRAGSFPLTILPGSAWEIQAPIPTGFGYFYDLNAVWDEVAYP